MPKSQFNLDKNDLLILSELQKDSGRTLIQLGKQLRMPATTVHNRIIRLKKAGIIKKYRAVVDYKKTGKNFVSFIFITVSSRRTINDVIEHLKRTPEIEDVYITTGSINVIAKARVADFDALSKLLFAPKTGLKSWDSISRLDNCVVLETVKENELSELK